MTAHVLSDSEYAQAVALCGQVVDAHCDHGVSGTVVGGLLGQLREVLCGGEAS